MKNLAPPAFDLAAMERRSESFRSTVTKQLQLLPVRTLFDLRPRYRLFTAAAAAVALERTHEVRDQLSTIARLAALSLEAGETPREVSIALRWPPEVPALTTHGPADPVGASDWVFAYSAALVADDAEAERLLVERRGQVRHAKGVHVDPYWAALADAWVALAASDVGAAGAHLARALELADPEATIVSPESVLAVAAPAIELMFQALEGDQSAFTAALEKGLERIGALSQTHDELAMLPVYLLAAARLGLRRGLQLELDGLQVAALRA